MSWPQVPFDSLIAHSAFGPRFSGDCYADEGNVATLRTTDLSADGVISSSSMPEANIDEEKFSEHFLRAGDLVISRSGRIGTTAVFKGHHKPVLPGAFLIRFRLDCAKADPLFYRYFFNSLDGQQRLLSIARGAAQQNINITNVRALNIPLPPLGVQKSIAERLGYLDDLIENNRRRIALLEQSARLLYREWFVHLRFPGHEHVKVVGGVPEGWRRTTIGAEAEFLGRGITPSYDDEGLSLVINQKCIRNRMLSLNPARRQSKEVPVQKLVRLGDVLINSTGKGTLGRIAQVIGEISNCTVDSHVTIVRPSGEVGKWFFGQAIAALEVLLTTMGRGATNQTELSRDDVAELALLVPSPAIIDEFEGFALPVSKQIGLLSEKNERLRQGRDLLLPRLMSGQLVV